MALWKDRVRFCELKHQLEAKIIQDGKYKFATDFVKRCLDCPTGHPASAHKLGLAVDIHLYLPDGDYMGDKKGEEKAHDVYGEYWESLDPKCNWGGRFGDANHYSYGDRK